MSRMGRAAPWVACLALLYGPTAASAQAPFTARAAALFESYSFKPGLSFSKATEMTVPVGADVRIGRRGSFTISTGFANVKVITRDSSLGTQTVSKPLDTETRLTWGVLPGRLIVLVNGVVPTGAKTVQKNQLAVLGAISSDLVGYTASSLGSGGSVGGGAIAAMPLGRFSAGFGATYKQSLSYQPVAADAKTIQPGSELRVRVGVEGGLARRTFLRVAAIVAQSSNDKVNGATQNGIGLRVIGYLSLNQTFGKVAVTAYGFDVYRGSPQVEQNALGAALMPKGNLLAGGARADYALGSKTVLSPRLEFRTSAGASGSSATLERLGSSIRFGVDARQRLKPGMAAVLQAGGVTGSIIQATSVSFRGLRIALSVEYTP